MLRAASSLPVGGFASAELAAREATECGLIRLQVFHRGEGLVEAAAARLGLALPGPGVAARHGEELLFWTAPGEWLIAVEQRTERERADALRRLLGDTIAVVTPITDARVVLALSGPRLRDVLARGSSVDFHPRVFGRARAVLTRFAHIPVLLTNPVEEHEFLLVADRSLAHHLCGWLQDAAAGFDAARVTTAGS